MLTEDHIYLNKLADRVSLKNSIKTRYFCYSKNTNKINVQKSKNQTIPSGYLPTQSTMKTLEQAV